MLIVSITEAGEILKEQAVKIPYKMGGCVNLDKDDAKELYRILRKMLSDILV